MGNGVELHISLRYMYLTNDFSPRPVADPEANLGVSRGQKGKSGRGVPLPLMGVRPPPPRIFFKWSKMVQSGVQSNLRRRSCILCSLAPKYTYKLSVMGPDARWYGGWLIYAHSPTARPSLTSETLFSSLGRKCLTPGVGVRVRVRVHKNFKLA